MPTISDIRQKYPEYNDLSDQQLADRLHTAFYSDMPAQVFYKKINYNPPSNSPGNWAAAIGSGVTSGLSHAAEGLGGLSSEAYKHPIAAAALGMPQAAFMSAQTRAAMAGAATQTQGVTDPLNAATQAMIKGRNFTGPQSFAQGLAGAAPAIAGAFVPGVGPFLTGGMMAAQSAGESDEQARARGKYGTPEAERARLESAGAGGILGTIGGAFIPELGAAAKPGIRAALGRIATASGVNAASMGAMQVGTNAAEKYNLDPNQSLFEGVPQAALTGAVLGGGGHGLAELAARKAIREANAPKPAPEAPIAPPGPEIAPYTNAQGQRLLPPPDTIYQPSRGPDQIHQNPNPREPVQPYGAPGENVPTENQPGIAGLVNAETAPAVPRPSPPNEVPISGTLSGASHDILHGLDEAPTEIAGAPQLSEAPATTEGGETLGLAQQAQPTPPEMGSQAGPATGPGHPLDPIISIVRGETKAPDPGKTLLQFISKAGGIDDSGGELAAIDAGKWHQGKIATGKLIKDTGLTLGDMAERAADAGYPGLMGPEGRGDPNLLVEAMRQELAGKPIRTPESVEPLEVRAQADALEEQLHLMGIDPRTASHEEILGALAVEHPEEMMGDEPPPVQGPEDYNWDAVPVENAPESLQNPQGAESPAHIAQADREQAAGEAVRQQVADRLKEKLGDQPLAVKNVKIVKNKDTTGTEHHVTLNDGSTVVMTRDTDQFGPHMARWTVDDPLGKFDQFGDDYLGDTKKAALENLTRVVERGRESAGEPSKKVNADQSESATNQEPNDNLYLMRGAAAHEEDYSHSFPANDVVNLGERDRAARLIGHGDILSALGEINSVEDRVKALDALSEIIDELGRKSSGGESFLERVQGRIDDHADAIEGKGRGNFDPEVTAALLRKAFSRLAQRYPGDMPTIAFQWARGFESKSGIRNRSLRSVTISQIRQQVIAELNRMGMGDISTEFKTHLTEGYGSSPSTVYGAFHPDSPMGRVIKLATDVYEPNISDEALGRRIMGAANHEIMHALRSLDVLKPEEWRSLEKEAARKISSTGETYQVRAEGLYPELDKAGQREEAIAEMFREWKEQGGRVNSQPTGLLSRLFKMLKGIIRGFGRSNADQIFDKIQSGEVGARARGSGGMGDQLKTRLMSSAAIPPDEKIISQYDVTRRAIKSAITKIAPGNAKALKIADDMFIGLQDQQTALAAMVHKALGMGVDLREDPRTIQTNLPGRIEDITNAYHQTFVKTMNKLARKSGVTEGMVAKLEQGLPKDSYVKALSDNFKDMSPLTKLVDASLHADHAPERNLYVRDQLKKTRPDATGKQVPVEDGSGMSNSEAAAIKKYISTLPPEIQDRLREITNTAKASIEYTRQLRIQSGLDHDWKDELRQLRDYKKAQEDIVNDPNKLQTQKKTAQTQLDRVNRAINKIPDFQHYVPLRGQLATEHADNPFFGEEGAPYGASGGYGVKGKEDPTLLGRSSHAGDILANIHSLAATTIQRAAKNGLDQALERLVKRAGGEIEGYAKLLPEDPSKPGAQLLPKVEARGADGQITQVVDPNMRDSDSPYLPFKVDGEQRWLELKDPTMVTAMKGLPFSGDRNLVQRAFDWATRGPMNFMRAVTVQSNPFFGPILAFRHTGVASLYAGRYEPGAWTSIIAKTGGYFADLMANKPEAMRRLAALRAEGGAGGLFSTHSITDHVNGIQNDFDALSHAEQSNKSMAARLSIAKSYANKLDNFMRKFNNHMEWSTRVAVYETFLEKGYSPAKAAQISRELTIDFDRHGTASPAISQLYMFANATLQDAGALTGAAIASPTVRRGLAMLAAAGLAEAPLNYILGGKDKDGNYNYDQISEAAKTRSMIFMIPGTEGGYVRIPVLYGPAAFYNVGRNVFDGVTGKRSIPGALGDSIMGFVNSFSVLGGAEGGLFHMITPTIGRPVEEVIANTPWYGKGAIHPNLDAYGEGKAPSQVHKTNTSPLAIGAADALHKLSGGLGEYGLGKIEIPPDDLQYLSGQMFGSLGQNLAKIAGVANALNPQKEVMSGHQFSPADIPVASQFSGMVTHQSVQDNYENYATPVIAAFKSYEAALKAGNNEEAAQIQVKRAAELQAYSSVEGVEYQRKALNQALKQYRASTTVPVEQQVQVISAMREQLDNAERTELKALRAARVHPSDY